ncbi:trigger factor [Pontiella agarivorans]|uniref:Trigger factor n=1 Tax=Pontiella agarivorans TaxID=3038953 RepID=A0ABU5N092_9BACT|nr:trigger factor [Pontiella agarivorans]MDZ8119870.1 trigger factor [Pontiella agarivorans]
MNVSVKDDSACRKIMTIEIPADKIAEEKAETLKAYIKFANIPGFRKGKAPKHVIAKKYASDINKDLQERVLPKFYHEALAETELKVVNVVDATEPEIADDAPVSFDVTVDIEPEFTLPKYTAIPIKEEKVEVTDEQVQAQIDMILNQHANYEEVEGKAIEAGDMGQLTYEATTEGQPLQDAIPEAKGIGSGEGYWVSADEHAFIPGMGEALVGLNIGDKKEVEVTFPEDFMVKELAGVKALYNIEVTAVRVRTVPELNEDILSKLQVESEETLRASIREQLEAQAANAALGKKHEQIVEYLIKKTKLEVPESVVQQQTRNVINDIANRRMMMGETQDAIMADLENLQKEAADQALENVKLRYIGLGIAKEEGFEASEMEIDEEIASMAIQQRKDAQALRKEMMENGSIDSVGEQIRFNKALDYMVDNAKVK